MELGKVVNVFQWLNSKILWGPPALIFLLGTHIFLTLRLRFIQRYIGTAIKLSISRDGEGQGDVSQFGALATALAATIGTGNIVGVATAIAGGGPGAVFWCWITGVFGIATKYSEAVLAVKYRVRTEDGSMAGGPMYVLERALKCRWAGVLFSIFAAIAAFGIGNTVQANAISGLAYEAMNIPRWVTGIVLMFLTGVVILGGVRSIARVCGALVPFMAGFYVIGCIIILLISYSTIPETIKLIISHAFTGKAMAGGFLGRAVIEAMRYGVSRGLFSNESGLGSAPIVAAAAQTRNPVRQALVSASGTFWDTVVVCAITGLVLVNTGVWNSGLEGAKMTHAAFDGIPYIGPIVLTVGLLTFVYSTILGWSYYGEKAVEYLIGKGAIFPYRILWVAAIMVGSLSKLNLVWEFADSANMLMAIPNLVSLLFLNGVIVAETRKYLWNNNLDAEVEAFDMAGQYGECNVCYTNRNRR